MPPLKVTLNGLLNLHAPFSKLRINQSQRQQFLTPRSHHFQLAFIRRWPSAWVIILAWSRNLNMPPLWENQFVEFWPSSNGSFLGWFPPWKLHGIPRNGWLLFSQAWTIRSALFSFPNVSYHFPQTTTFITVDRIVSLAIALHRNQYLEPKITIDDRSIMFKMITKLLGYLNSNFAVYHVRATNLIWGLQGSTTRPYVESILAQSMTSPEHRNVGTYYEAFGVLWRFSGMHRE